MSFGSGHTGSLMRRIRVQAQKKLNRRNKFKTKDRKGLYLGNSSEKTSYDFPKISAYQLAELKKKIRSETKKAFEKRILILFLTIFLPALILFIVFNTLKI